MPAVHKVTVFCEDFDEHPSEDFIWVKAWLKKWGESVLVADYSTGGWEHLWDVSGPREAIEEIPERLLCGSDWAGFS